MATLNDINPNEFINELADSLKGTSDIKPPKWAGFVKTGRFKERPPASNDWWYMRAAAVLKSVYRLGPVGTSKLRTKYGGKKNRGVAAEHSYKGSGNIIRKILQQLEKAGLVAQGTKGIHKGRIITPKGKSLMNSIAKKISPKITSETGTEKSSTGSIQAEAAKPAEHKKAEAKAEKKAHKEKKAKPAEKTENA
ncbi:30S ribosomal protein S19e [Candidatus Woesearchaeota archaeon]|nr:30S ribosomal protein S19e [Candidatus Woesearchaeota archaeon]